MTDVLAKIEGDVSELQDDMSQAQEKLIVHETRFGNGQKAMSEMRTDIEVLQPKSPDWLKMFLAGLSVVGILMGAQLWLSDRFNDRPTHREVDKGLLPIRSAQKETAGEIKEIEKSQSATKTAIKNIEATQNKQGAKLDRILERLPVRRSNR